MEIKYIKTSDVDMASALLSLGFPIDGINPTGENNYLGEPKMEFYLKQTPDLLTAMEDFKDRKLRLEPKMLFFNRRELIQRMKESQ